MSWADKVMKSLGIVPKPVRLSLAILMADVEDADPVRGNWPNYCFRGNGRHLFFHTAKAVLLMLLFVKKARRVFRSWGVSLLERTGKPYTKGVALVCPGRARKVREAVAAMRVYGFDLEEDAVPWGDAQGYADDELPGVFLAGARYREGLTQAERATPTGIPASAYFRKGECQAPDSPT